MTTYIAINTIQARLNGRPVSYAPGTRFEMLDAEAEHLIRLRAARHANPQDVSPISTHVEPVQAPVQVSAPVTPEADVTPVETADVAPVEAPKAKRTRKAKPADAE